jgi:hypothetical protein
MAVMVAAGPDRGFEFFAQPRLKIKKPALISQVRAVKPKENLKYLKN